MLNGLDLFSGIGGIGQALSPWVRTQAYCERERFPQAVLLSRMERGEIDRAPIWDDVCTLRGDMLPPIDIISGGFPCQDISFAGKAAGLGAETRSGLYSEIIRLAGELRPAYIFLENVSAITIRGGERVIADLTKAGYNCEWLTLSASDVGATHGRERWWCLAHAMRKQLQGERPSGEQGPQQANGQVLFGRDSHGLADTEPFGLQRRELESERFAINNGAGNHRPPPPSDLAGWVEYLKRFPTAQPAIRGSAAWLQNRSNRIKSLGNSVDVICARQAFKILAEAYNGRLG